MQSESRTIPARAKANMAAQSPSSWLPAPTREQNSDLWRGNRKTSAWMYFQPHSSSSRRGSSVVKRAKSWRSVRMKIVMRMAVRRSTERMLLMIENQWICRGTNSTFVLLPCYLTRQSARVTITRQLPTRPYHGAHPGSGLLCSNSLLVKTYVLDYRSAL